MAERVTVQNFKRAESHFYFRGLVDASGIGKLHSERGPAPVDGQTVIRLNRDTPYTSGVFDLTAPVTIVKPDAGKRFQSMFVVNEDHFIKHVAYDGGRYELTRDTVGTRYAMVAFRTFMDPNDPGDVKGAHALQDAIQAIQAEPGRFEIPDWDQDQRRKLHDAILPLGAFLQDSRGMFGDVSDVDPVAHLIGTAAGWGGNRLEDAMYVMAAPPSNDGKTPFVLTVPADTPVDAFWSITIYNEKGFYEAPENAISVNGVTAKKAPDGSATVHFGGDPKQDNFLRIMPGWNYAARLYRPRKALLDGSWKFPEPKPVG